MKFRNIYLVSLFIVFFSSPANSMTCEHFTSIGHPVNSIDEIANSPATKSQVKEFKKVIADHAERVSMFGFFSSRKKSLKKVMKNDELFLFIMRNSLVLTRVECFSKTNDSMEDVAIEQFDYLLDGASKGYDHEK